MRSAEIAGCTVAINSFLLRKNSLCSASMPAVRLNSTSSSAAGPLTIIQKAITTIVTKSLTITHQWRKNPQLLFQQSNKPVIREKMEAVATIVVATRLKVMCCNTKAVVESGLGIKKSNTKSDKLPPNQDMEKTMWRNFNDFRTVGLVDFFPVSASLFDSSPFICSSKNMPRRAKYDVIRIVCLLSPNGLFHVYTNSLKNSTKLDRAGLLDKRVIRYRRTARAGQTRQYPSAFVLIGELNG
jgi:hypothetical protein